MTTVTNDQLADQVNEAVAALMRPDPESTPESRLIAAGDFVARYGTLADVYNEDVYEPQALAAAQFWVGDPTAAFNLLGHWSVERDDDAARQRASYIRQHLPSCAVCDYLESALEVREAFQGNLCGGCGLDIDSHDVAPGPTGAASAYCRPEWVRQEPWVSVGGDVYAGTAGAADTVQISDSFDARWVAQLVDGTYAVVTRTYYIARSGGRILVERQDEYLVCTNLADPGGTEVGSEALYSEVDSYDPVREDPESLARTSFTPDAAEWRAHAPAWARGLLTGAPAGKP